MAESSNHPKEQLIASRSLAASASAIFAILTDPARHPDTEPNDWVRSAIDPKPITGTGQTFAMNMHFDDVSGDYRMDNTVTTFEPDQAIAWDPGQIDDTGTVAPGGWRWRYDLAEDEGQTTVTLTYDWSDTTPEVREAFGGFPVVSPEYLDRSLQTLEQAATGIG